MKYKKHLLVAFNMIDYASTRLFLNIIASMISGPKSSSPSFS